MSQTDRAVPHKPSSNDGKYYLVVQVIPWAVALVTYLAAVVFTPDIPGCACFTRWHLLPWVLVLFAFAAAAYAQHRRDLQTSRGSAMPSAARMVLTVYLLVVGVCLVFMLVSLNSLDFPEAAVMPQPRATPIPTATPTPNPTNNAAQNTAGAPANQQTPGGTTANTTAANQPNQPATRTTTTTTPLPTPVAPILLRVFPQATVGSTPKVSLTVYGEHFSEKSVVRFNGVPVAKEFISDNLIAAPLEPAHLLQVGSITVDVENPPGLLSNALIVPVSKPTVSLNVFFCWHPSITREAQLLLLVIFAGALGSYLHAIMSLADFIGNRTLKASWFWWYVSRPFLGMAMALVFYAVVRGGFLAGTPADANVVNPFGVLAIGALVGMFSDKAAQKLKEIFDVVFTAKDERADKLNKNLVITAAGGSLPDATVDMDYQHSLDVSGGTAPYTWSLLTSPDWLNIDPTTGILSGLPQEDDLGDAIEVIIKVEDDSGAFGETKLTLNVRSGLSSPPVNGVTG
jgi:hypothetical protein